MRFLLFNAVVAFALLYLFTGGERPKEKVGATIGSMKTFASQAVNDVRNRLEKPRPTAKTVKPPVMTVKTPEAPPKPVPKRKPEPIAAAAPPAQPAEILPPPEPAPMPVVPPAPVERVTVAEIAPPKAVAREPKPVPPAPEVIKRRAEVLAESAPPAAGDTRAVEIGGDGQLMTPEERRKALLRLAEDMELFSVGVTSR